MRRAITYDYSGDQLIIGWTNYPGEPPRVIEIETRPMVFSFVNGSPTPRFLRSLPYLLVKDHMRAACGDPVDPNDPLEVTPRPRPVASVVCAPETTLWGKPTFIILATPPDASLGQEDYLPYLVLGHPGAMILLSVERFQRLGVTKSDRLPGLDLWAVHCRMEKSCPQMPRFAGEPAWAVTEAMKTEWEGVGKDRPAVEFFSFLVDPRFMVEFGETQGSEYDIEVEIL